MKVKVRIGSIDTVRGILILGVVVYHVLYDLVYIYGYNIPWFRSSWANLVQELGAMGFMLISGYCFTLSRSNLKRGVLLTVVGFLISIFTYYFYPSGLIIMGIISLMGFSILITLVIDKFGWFSKNPRAGFYLSLLLFIICFDIPKGYISASSFINIELTKFLYASNFTAMLGFPHVGFRSVDYFPLLPWFFVFLAGYFHGKTKRSFLPVNLNIPGLNFLGRNTLVIYVLHQPVALMILNLIMKK